jgi:2',3'-cyclic-nucleotide 2'-phosphodiesterase (5'-nucleotidase family)
MAEESGHQVDPSVAVLFTNDIHSNYDQDIGYDGLMLLKKELGQQYAHVILVDAGAAVQGAPIGSISEGHEPIRIMNEVGYTISTNEVIPESVKLSSKNMSSPHSHSCA